MERRFVVHFAGISFITTETALQNADVGFHTGFNLELKNMYEEIMVVGHAGIGQISRNYPGQTIQLNRLYEDDENGG